MSNPYKKHIDCKYGVHCKYGFFCKFNHPERHGQQSNFETLQLQQNQEIYNLNQQFGLINLSYENQPYAAGYQQQFANDAQYQQFLHQHQTCQNFAPQKLMSEPKEKSKAEKKNDQDSDSSDSNSDQQSDSDEDKKQKKNIFEKVKENKNQKLNYLYGQDKIKKENKKAYRQQHCRKRIDEQSYYIYHQALHLFFEKRHIKQHKREGIVRFLAKEIKYEPVVLEKIVSIIEQFEKEGFVSHFCYKKLFKTIVKENFEIEAIRAKLMKKINIDKKRKAKDEEFNKRFPFPFEVQFLESKNLLQNYNTRKDTIYLIDGNNCLTTQKHLRYFFQQKDEYSKAQAQIRFRFLISKVIEDSEKCFIFFDDKFGSETYTQIMYRLMSAEEEIQMVEHTTVIYAEEGKEADEMIRRKMKEMKEKIPLQRLNDIILVTADRILVQECCMIHPIKRSSGLYMIKFLKKQLKKQAKFNPFLKKTIKRILNYGDSKY